MKIETVEMVKSITRDAIHTNIYTTVVDKNGKSYVEETYYICYNSQGRQINQQLNDHKIDVRV
jgi:hypothetical protein